jgi:hypothetical protein
MVKLGSTESLFVFSPTALNTALNNANTEKHYAGSRVTNNSSDEPTFCNRYGYDRKQAVLEDVTTCGRIFSLSLSLSLSLRQAI